MAQRPTLSEQQVAILRWISDDCPEGVMKGTHHRISAAALRRRGLVKINGKGPTWRPTLTVAGREYLNLIDGPRPPEPRQANVSVTEQLMRDVVTAGGTLRLPRPAWHGRPGIDYAHRARLAERHGKVPPGKWLSIEIDRDMVELRFEDMAEGAATTPPKLVAVPIPEVVGRHHTAARVFRDGRAKHRVSQNSLPRAVRLVEAVAREAQRRRWKVRAETAGLRIELGNISVDITMKERGVHRRGPWEEDVKRYRNYRPIFARERSTPNGAYDQDATGELELAIAVTPCGGFDGRQSRWSDRQSWTLEQRLPHLFQEIQHRVVLAERFAIRQRLAAERAAEAQRHAQHQREQRWHELTEQARARLLEDHRATSLRAQADAWREAERLRQYCAALEAAHSEHPETATLLTWARRYIEAIDPLSTPPALPATPEPTAEALQPYLPRGWSAYGPDRR